MRANTVAWRMARYAPNQLQAMLIVSGHNGRPLCPDLCRDMGCPVGCGWPQVLTTRDVSVVGLGWDERRDTVQTHEY